MSSRERFTTRGIVIRIHPFGEADLVVRLVSPQHGKITGLARHARRSKKRFAPRFDLFDFGTYELSRGRGSMFTISAFQPERGLPTLRENLDKLVAASILGESWDTLLAEEDTHEEGPFELLEHGLRNINDAVTLRDVLRELCVALQRALQHNGLLDPALDRAPSALTLQQLIRQIERSAERKLGSAAMIDDLLHRVRD